jgi:hypothetical protein
VELSSASVLSRPIRKKLTAVMARLGDILVPHRTPPSPSQRALALFGNIAIIAQGFSLLAVRLVMPDRGSWSGDLQQLKAGGRLRRQLSD